MPATMWPPRTIEYCPDPRWPWKPMWTMAVPQAGTSKTVTDEEGRLHLEFDLSASGATKGRFGLRRWWRWLTTLGPLRSVPLGRELRRW